MHTRVLASLIAVMGVQVLAAVPVVSLHRSEAWLRRALPYVISVAVGVLLATGTVHLLPEAIATLGNRSAVWLMLVLTMLALYSFERLFQVVSGVSAEPATDAEDAHARGLHNHHHASKPATLLLGSFTHSLVDGTGVAAAFAIGPQVGWVTALAVGLHEVPHRLGDFALLVHMGIARGRAALLAIAAGGSSLLGWAVVAALGDHGSHHVAWLLPVSAGSFLYISLVDLLPELQHERRPMAVLGQILGLAVGIALALGLTQDSRSLAWIGRIVEEGVLSRRCVLAWMLVEPRLRRLLSMRSGVELQRIRMATPKGDYAGTIASIARLGAGVGDGDTSRRARWAWGFRERLSERRGW